MSEASGPREIPETEMLDAVITLDATSAAQTQALATELQGLGLRVVRIDASNGVIEGTIKADQFGALRRAHGVRYVRSRFEYMAAPRLTERREIEDQVLRGPNLPWVPREPPGTTRPGLRRYWLLPKYLNCG